MTPPANNREGEEALRSRGIFRDTVWLVAGTVVSGLAAYGYVILGTRVLGAVGFAPISVLWTFWAMSAAVLTFPTMHWVIRTMEADKHEGRIRAALPRVVFMAVIVSAVTGVAAWAGRKVLFQQSGLVFPLLAAVIPFGSVAVGLARGALAGRQRFLFTGGAIAAENLIRLCAAGVVVAMGGGQAAFAATLIVGFAAAGLWPSALAFRRDLVSSPGPSPLVFLGGVAGGSLIAQIVITGGPVLLAAIGGAPAQITGLFAALALFRAPYMVATGVAARVTGTLTRLIVDHEREKIRRISWGTVAAVLVAVPLGAVFGTAFGPWLVRAVFGSEVMVPDSVAGVIAAGSVLALVSLFYTLMLVAGAQTTLVLVAWVAGLIVAGGWGVAGPGDPLQRVAWAFCLAEAMALSVMLAGDARPWRTGQST